MKMCEGDDVKALSYVPGLSPGQPPPNLTPGWRYAHYFEFVRRKDRNVTVRCKLCPGQKLLSTAANTT